MLLKERSISTLFYALTYFINYVSSSLSTFEGGKCYLKHFLKTPFESVP